MYKTQLKELLDENPGCHLIFLGRQGSYLYGTNTPESDLDIKGIFIPSKDIMYLGNVPKTIQNDTNKAKGVKNTKDDVDIQLFSIQYFFQLAMEGQTIAIDMLHTNFKNILENSYEWFKIQSLRELFYSKNMSAFIGYAKKQAELYSLKGSRLTSLRNCINILSKYDGLLKHLWNSLPQDENSQFIESSPNGIKQYKICGKILQENMSIDSALGFINTQIEKYGERALKSESNDGYDHKAFSHSIRAAYELEELFSEGNITFPLKNVERVLDIKLGKVPYKEVIDELVLIIDRVKELADNSIFPENVNRELCKIYLLNLIKGFHNEHI